jgi:hypothetical protein
VCVFVGACECVCGECEFMCVWVHVSECVCVFVGACECVCVCVCECLCFSVLCCQK